MKKNLQIQVAPNIAATEKLLKRTLAKELDIFEQEIKHIDILKRSIDARQRLIKVNLKVDIYINEEFVKKEEDLPEYKNVSGKDEIIIIGGGMVGLSIAYQIIKRDISKSICIRI